MKRIYLVLALLGFAIPYYFFLTFLFSNGLDIELMIAQLFANPISTFFAVDLIITAIAFLLFSYREARLIGFRRWWIFLLSTLLIGPSFALPLFLYTREGRAGRGDHAASRELPG